MKRGILKLIISYAILSMAFTLIPVLSFAESGVYVGGHFRRARPATVEILKNSGFTYVILFNITVQEDGTLTSDGDEVCKDGVYVFDLKQPDYKTDVASLKEGSTSISRIETCIGGWTNLSYYRIKDLINAQGTGENSILYKNFKALKEALPWIDAINNDDEGAYDAASAIRFHVMLYDLGFTTTLAPYRMKTYWEELAVTVNQQRPGAVSHIYIQCYDGGAGNDPADWHLGENIPLHAGRLNYQDFDESIRTMQEWKNNKGVTGGFFWVYNDETWNLNRYATAVNRIFNTPVVNPVVTVYEEKLYAGYSVGLKEGVYTKAQLAGQGVRDKDISSLTITPGYSITVYQQDHCSGSSRTYTEDRKNFLVLDNDVSSLKIELLNSSLSVIERFVPPFIKYDRNTGILTITVSNEDRLSISSLSGQEIYSSSLSAGTNTLAIRLPEGQIYIMSFAGHHFSTKCIF